MAFHHHAEKPAAGDRLVEIDIEVEGFFGCIVQQRRAKVAAWEREVLPPIPLDPARA